MDYEWEKITPEIAVALLGEPNKKDGNSYRWGNKGSLTLDLEKSAFFDFEANDGGGLTWLIQREGLDVNEVLEPYKNKQPKVTAKPKPKKTYKTYTDKDMFALKAEAEIFTRYSDDFCVMRFKPGHQIKQKYAPFSRQNGSWVMKRPEGKLPIFCTNKNPEGYVVINEGEKACLGAESIFTEGDVACWHGGVGNIENCDWTPLTNRKVIIFPDKDEQGLKCGQQLKDLLEPITKECMVVKPPRNFKEKDDLYDAKINDFFKNSNEFLDYCLANVVKKRVSFELVQVNQILKNIQPPNWLVKNIAERNSIVGIFGAPKSGKSFASVDIAANIGVGRDWHGHKTTKYSIIYLAGEGQRNISRRFSAWQTLNDQSLSNAPIFVSNRGARLLDDKDHQLLKDHIYEVEDNIGEVGCIFVDTLQRAFSGNESSSQDMSEFIERVDDLRDTFNSTIFLIHHSGHGNIERARGSSVLQASVDWEYRVKRTNLGSDMFVEFSQSLVKDGVPMKTKNFKFVEQKLSFIDDMSSGALQLIDEADLPKPQKITDKDQLIMDCIVNTQKQASDPSSIWLKHNEIITITGLDKSAVNRALKKLKDANLLLHEDSKGYQSKELSEQLF